MTYLIVKDGEQIRIVNFPAFVDVGRSIRELLKRLSKGTMIVKYEKALPDYPIECLFWTSEGGGGIEIRAELEPIDWFLLLTKLHDLPVRLKMSMGQSYLQLTQASIENDTAWLGQIYLTLEKLDPADQVLINDALEASNIPHNFYLEAPF